MANKLIDVVPATVADVMFDLYMEQIERENRALTPVSDSEDKLYDYVDSFFDYSTEHDDDLPF